MHDTPPPDDTIIALIGEGIEPNALIAQLRSDYDMADVIEALQRAIERGKIGLDSDGMVIAVRTFAQAA
jgi:hypothetical protein